MIKLWYSKRVSKLGAINKKAWMATQWPHCELSVLSSMEEDIFFPWTRLQFLQSPMYWKLIWLVYILCFSRQYAVGPSVAFRGFCLKDTTLIIEEDNVIEGTFFEIFYQFLVLHYFGYSVNNILTISILSTAYFKHSKMFLYIIILTL